MQPKKVATALWIYDGIIFQHSSTMLRKQQPSVVAIECEVNPKVDIVFYGVKVGYIIN